VREQENRDFKGKEGSPTNGQFERIHYSSHQERKSGPKSEIDHFEVKHTVPVSESATQQRRRPTTANNNNNEGQQRMDGMSSSYSSGLSCNNPTKNPKPILKQQPHHQTTHQLQQNSIEEVDEEFCSRNDEEGQREELYERQELYESLMRQYYDEMEKLEGEQARVRELLGQQIQHNLAMQRGPKSSQFEKPQKYPSVPFEGPFFRLEEVDPRGVPVQNPPPPPFLPSPAANQPHFSPQHEELDEMGRVVVWPPVQPGKKQKVDAPQPKNIKDPEKLEEYQKQLKSELDSLRRNEEQTVQALERQLQALRMQQEALKTAIQEQYPDHLGYEASSSKSLRLFEARPISGSDTTGDSLQPIDAKSSPGTASNFSNGQANPTWRRTYILDLQRKKKADEQNEILFSGDVLQRERFEIDLLKRRETFIEKAEEPPEIVRLGRCWQPPPDTVQPVILKRYGPISVQTNGGPMDEHGWEPVITDPEFKSEHKLFTPALSPPGSPIHGYGNCPNK
jgi:hypothetical protein